MAVLRSCDRHWIGDLSDTSVDRSCSGPAGAKTRQGLTDAKLRDMPLRVRAYKVSDGGNGLYVVISPSGNRSFRYDYRLGGRRETLTIGRHEPVARHCQRSHLAYGMDVTLEEARLLLARARLDVSCGRSPARAKVEQRNEVADSMSLGRWATRCFEFKSDAKSGAELSVEGYLNGSADFYGTGRRRRKGAWSVSPAGTVVLVLGRIREAARD